MPFKKILIIFCVLAATVLGILSFDKVKKAQRLKEDLVELSSIKYGLFNVDEWKLKISRVVIQKVEGLEITPANKAKMRVKISGLLHKIISKSELSYKQEKKRSLKGLLQLGGANIFGMFEHLKNDIPNITNEIVNFLENAENRAALSGFINEKIKEYSDSTFSETDYTLHDSIISKHGALDKEVAVLNIKNELNDSKGKRQILQFSILFLALLVFMALLSKWSFKKSDLTLISFFILILLLLGLSLPMIDIDARISSLKFSLMGEGLLFEDQVLFYKSKSIIEVVWLMLSQGKMDVGLVGCLVLSFSVIFPLSKLVATNILLYSPKLKYNKVLSFLAYKTGKWSMADVMVVAIFMSYIGFSGIVGDQLRQLEKITKTVEILTTNQSTLQTGFFFFTAFAVLSILLANRIHRSSAAPGS